MRWFHKKYRYEDILVLFIYLENGNNYHLERFKFARLKDMKHKCFGSIGTVRCLDGSTYKLGTFSHVAALNGASLISLLDKHEDFDKTFTRSELLSLEEDLNQAYFKDKTEGYPWNDNFNLKELF